MARAHRSLLLLLSIACVLLSLCATASADEPTDVERADAVERLQRIVRDLDGLSPEALVERRALDWQALGYDPSAAKHLDLLQASELALSDEALARLAQHGFVIDSSSHFGTFTRGYEVIYRNDLPLYVSADSILYAVHRSFERLLSTIEEEALHPGLDIMITDMRNRLAEGALDGFDDDVVHDVDVYLAVALGLLRGGVAVPLAGGDEATATSLIHQALDGEGILDVELFGAPRQIDFSQFEPRGHYTDSAELEKYFRASMWLGRIDLRMLETQLDGSVLLQRRQLDAALAMTLLLEGAARSNWERTDRALTTLVGVGDSMSPTGARHLMADLGTDTPLELARLTDDAVVDALLAGDYGQQRIASRVMARLPEANDGKPLPRDRSFSLLGQRFALDSMVLSNVTYDRVTAERGLPSPLDVAYAALGNDAAVALLRSELDAWRYAPQLEASRLLVDEHRADQWQGSLYMLWLSSLRSLSAERDAIAAPNEHGLPTVAATEAWSRRMLNTQLASWAELRHDTVLYVKQSYSDYAACEYPDAFVDPYPAFFAALEAYAALGGDQLAALDIVEDRTRKELETYFDDLHEVTGQLREIAERQRDGKPLEDAHLAWLNKMVKETRVAGCGGDYEVDTPGWYQALFFRADANEPRTTIVDVHTNPDPDTPGVLHVATGHPELLVVTVDSPEGPRSFVGLASSYYEHTTTRVERLNDIEWDEMLHDEPPRPAWLDDLRNTVDKTTDIEKDACGYHFEDEDIN